MEGEEETYLVVTLFSPGKRSYKISLENTETNKAYLADHESQKQLLAQVKELGIEPEENNNSADDQELAGDSSAAINVTDNFVEVNDHMVKVRSVNNSKAKQRASSTLAESSIRNVSKSSSTKRGPVFPTNDEIMSLTQHTSRVGARSKDNQVESVKTVKKTNISEKVPNKAANCRVENILENKQLIFEVEHRILEEVFQNPPLFNTRLELKKRTPEIKQSLYNMIAEMLNDEFEILKLNWRVVENTFNDLRAKYVRYTNALKLPSGSGANRMPAKPKHYEILRQNDILKERREQVCSLSAEGFKLHPPKGRYNKSNKQETPEEFSTLMKSANEYFENLNNPTTSLELARTEPTNSITTFPINCDPDVTFLLTILPSMKELPKAEKRKFQYEVMGRLNDKLERSEHLHDRRYRCDRSTNGQNEHQFDEQPSDDDK